MPAHALKPLLWVIWSALLLAILVYFAILRSGVMQGSEHELPPNLPGILAIVTLVLLFASVAIRLLVTNRAYGDPHKRTILINSCILSWALAESAAIFGLVLGLLGASIALSGSFFLASFAVMIFLTPNFSFSSEE